MEEFIYISDLETASGKENGQLKKSGSGYIAKYKDTVVKSITKNDWKNTGASAQFQQRQSAEIPEMNAVLSGVCPYSDEDFLYSVQVGDVSAILKKNYETDAEQYLIHSNKQYFSDLDFDRRSNRVAVAVSDDYQTSHIGTFDIERSDLNILTSGDAVDEHPSFSQKDGSILFSSRGVGRNNNLEKVGVGPSSIYRITDGHFSTCDVILAEENVDLIAPKEDKDGNIYYIRKPYKVKKSQNMTIGDLLLAPFRLFYNLFRLLFFLSQVGKKSKKKTGGNSGGANPSVTPEMSERDIYIMNERIHLAKEEKQNSKKGDKTAGYAPHSFELIKLSPDGAKTKLRSAVLSYDFDKEGSIVINNGKYIISLKDNNETVLCKDKLIYPFRIKK